MKRPVVWLLGVVALVACFFSYGHTRAAERTIGMDGYASTRAVLVALVTTAPLVWAAGLAVLWTVHAAMRLRRQRAGQCAACGYSSREVTRAVCPECGCTYDAAERADARDTLREGWRALVLVLVALAVGSVVAEMCLLHDDAQWKKQMAGRRQLGHLGYERQRYFPFERHSVGTPEFPALVRGTGGAAAAGALSPGTFAAPTVPLAFGDGAPIAAGPWNLRASAPERARRAGLDPGLLPSDPEAPELGPR